MVLLEIVIGLVEPLSMPINCCAVAAGPTVVIWMLFAVVVLPKRLFVIDMEPAVICVTFRLMVTVAEPVAVREPIVLFATLMCPVDVEAFMPTRNEPLVAPALVTVIDPLPVPLPTVFPVTVPTSALPPVTLIPVRAPVLVVLMQIGRA